MPHRDQIYAQVDRIAGSSQLRGAESLCRLLQYLAKHTLDHPGVPLKEYQIATEVLGRSADFDPQADSVVRVQAGRLRSKLAEYYGSDGAGDPVVIELPKGSYALSIHLRTAQELHPRAVIPTPSGWKAAAVKVVSSPWALTVLAVLFVAVLIGAGWLLASLRLNEPGAAIEGEVPPAAFQEFWKPFLGPQGPWVIFSNAAFIGRPEIGMRYYDPAKDAAREIWDHYTGVGEVLAVHNLDQVFAMLQHRIRVKRGSLFTLDEAQNNDLIFVGSPSENLTLLDIPNTQEFVFRRVAAGPRKGDLALVDLHPAPGKQSEFLASPSTSPLTEDYSVIGLAPGLDPKKSVLILAGTTTFGTEAAVEYLCRQSSLEELLSKLPKTKTNEVRPFEALLRVKIARGVPVETQLLAVRKRAQSSSGR